VAAPVHGKHSVCARLLDSEPVLLFVHRGAFSRSPLTSPRRHRTNTRHSCLWTRAGAARGGGGCRLGFRLRNTFAPLSDGSDEFWAVGELFFDRPGCLGGGSPTEPTTIVKDNESEK
jgi:hypothetical protein